MRLSFAFAALVLCLGCGGAKSTEPSTSVTGPSPVPSVPPTPSPTPAPAPSPTPTPAPPITLSGITFGTDISDADRNTIQLAYSLFNNFWNDAGVAVLAYSSIDAVIDAYIAACNCQLPSYGRRELTDEFTTTAPRVLLVVVGSQFHSMNREILIGSALIHSMTHAMQRGFSGGPVDPIWMAEGGAEYADVHAGLRGVEFLHQYGRNEAKGFQYRLNELETWPNNNGFNHPYGRAPYTLGHFATDLLTKRTSLRSSVQTFWRVEGENLRRQMPLADAWRDAFRSAFGISVEQFYPEFEEYRAHGFQ